MKWVLFDKQLPCDGDIVWVAFNYPDIGKNVQRCLFDSKAIVQLWEEDEGQWKGMGSTDFYAAIAWAQIETPEYPSDLGMGQN